MRLVRLGTGSAGRAYALGVGPIQALSWDAFRGTYFSLLVQRKVGKRKHTLLGGPAGFPAMLGAGGTRPNSAPYRRFGQSDASIPPVSCASRRLSRGPKSKAVLGSLLRNIAPATNRSPLPLLERAFGLSGTDSKSVPTQAKRWERGVAARRARRLMSPHLASTGSEPGATADCLGRNNADRSMRAHIPCT